MKKPSHSKIPHLGTAPNTRRRTTALPKSRLLFLACISLAQPALPASSRRTPEPSAEESLRLLERVVADELHPVAEIKAIAFLERFPKSPSIAQVRLWLAEAQHHQGRNTDALLTLKPLLPSQGAGRPAASPEAVCLAAECAADLGRFDQAETFYRDLLTFNPDYPRATEARLGLAWTLLQGETQKVREGEGILGVLAHDPDRGQTAQLARILQARNLLRLGRADEAAQHLTDLLVSRPDPRVRFEAHLWLGEILLSRNDPAQALGHFEQLTADPQPPRRDLLMRAWLQRGQCALATGDTPKALESFEKVLIGGIDETSRMVAARKLIESAAKAGSTREILDRIRQLAAEESSPTVAGPCLLAIAEAELAQQQPDAALATWNAAAKRFPKSPWAASALLRAGETLAQRNDPDKGLTLLRAAAEQAADPARAAECRFRLADILFDLARYADACDQFLAILDLPPATPLHEQALFNALLCLARQGKIDDFLKLHQRFATRFPQSRLRETAAAEQGRLESSAGLEAQARASWENLLETFPDSPRRHLVLFEIARSLMREGLFEEAARRLANLLADFPAGAHVPEAEFLRLAARRRLGADSPDASLSALKELLQKFPDAPIAGDVLFRIGEIYFSTEDFPNAQTWFTRLARNSPKHELADDALYFAGLAALRRDDSEPAVVLFEELAREFPKSPRLAEARLGQGHALRLQAKFAEALAVYESIASIAPAPPPEVLAMARIGEADCHFRLAAQDPKRYPRAAALYDEVLSDDALRQSRPDIIHEAAWKMGQSLEHAGRPAEALEAFTDVVYGRVLKPSPSAPPPVPEYHWFGKAAADAARILESRSDWRGALAVYRLAESVGGPDAPSWRTRRLKLQRDHFLYE